LHAVPISDKVRKRHEGMFNEPQRASNVDPLVPKLLLGNVMWPKLWLGSPNTKKGYEQYP